jgi:hypothetical protein
MSPRKRIEGDKVCCTGSHGQGMLSAASQAADRFGYFFTSPTQDRWLAPFLPFRSLVVSPNPIFRISLSFSFFLDCRTGVMAVLFILPAGSAKWRKQLRNIGQRSYRYCLRFEPMPRWPLNCPDVTYAIISHEVEKIAHVSRRRLFP